MEKEYLTPREAAKKLKRSESTVQKWLRSGRLVGKKVGNEWRVDAVALTEFLKDVRGASAAPAVEPGSLLFTTTEVIRLTGVNRKTLHHWTEWGFVTPSVLRQYGGQRVRLWSFASLVALRVLQGLHEVGLDFHVDRPVRFLVKHIEQREGLQDISPDAYLVTDGRAFFEVRADEFPALLRSLGAGICFTVALGAVVAEMLALVARGGQ